MEDQMVLQANGSPGGNMWLRNHDYKKRKTVVRSLVEEKPFLCSEERWLQALHEQGERKSGPHQSLMLRGLMSQLILSLDILSTVQIRVTCFMVQMRVTCLHLFSPLCKFSFRITITLLTTTSNFQRNAFRKMQSAAERLTKSIRFQKVFVSQMCLLIKTRHEDSHAWEYREKSSIAGSFRGISM